MLFDLSSTRRRRRAVKVIYGTLAVLIAGGLVLLGVGAGNGNGGIANSLVGNGGGSSSQNASINKAVKAAQAKVTAAPNSAAAWDALVQARWEQAGSSGNYDSTTGYTATGKADLKQMLTAYARYTSLLKGAPTEATSFEAAHADTVTGDYASAATAWQSFLQASPGALKGFECLAYNAYAAKDTNLADQAAAKTLALTPKLDQLTVKANLTQVKTSKTEAEEAALEDC